MTARRVASLSIVTLLLIFVALIGPRSSSPVFVAPGQGAMFFSANGGNLTISSFP